MKRILYSTGFGIGASALAVGILYGIMELFSWLFSVLSTEAIGLLLVGLFIALIAGSVAFVHIFGNVNKD